MTDHATICAIATSGVGAIAVIRLSGPDAYAIVQKIFRSSSGTIKFESLKPNTILFGTIQSGDKIIDEVLITLFRAPHSYTGEDVIEISCHGSLFIQQQIMELLVRHGALPAKPGEFTQRAFLNGKMDLSQAEAVADLVAAKSEASHDMAMNQMRGGFSNKIKDLRNRLLNFITLIELELDFSEEDVEFADRNLLSELIEEIYSLVKELTDSFQLGNVIKNGVPVAIVGRPNVGKSTLLNALLKEDRAIVSEFEGTTRDSIEDTVSIGGFVFRFIDTAGLRETADIIENLGIRRTYQKIQQASIVLFLAEANDNIDLIGRSLTAIRDQLTIDMTQSSSSKHPGEIMDKKQGREIYSAKHLVLVLNKSDRADSSRIKELLSGVSLHDNEHIIAISAKSDENVPKLEELLLNIIHAGSLKHQDIIVSNIRHFNALQSALDSLVRVREGLFSLLPSDLMAQDIREALHYLGEITGEVSTDEVLDNIFKNFCIGK
ncbi:MAG: tRNA uridine-5-carboxymethylaminomethyl(34) synthesis GTPase MnmE [Bacteroidales bacterium]|nr:tRNA uridine-5-carboxymethylaminomethyl(34) synthesis GTPase MnmE [Bacteroidales bacterium]